MRLRLALLRLWRTGARTGHVTLDATLLAATAVLNAQAPDFSGTWKLDEAKSRIVATAGIIGLIPPARRRRCTSPNRPTARS